MSTVNDNDWESIQQDLVLDHIELVVNKVYRNKDDENHLYTQYHKYTIPVGTEEAMAEVISTDMHDVIGEVAEHYNNRLLSLSKRRIKALDDLVKYG